MKLTRIDVVSVVVSDGLLRAGSAIIINRNLKY